MRAATARAGEVGERGSNTAGRIAELRKRIQANKGVAARARASAADLNIKACNAEAQVRTDQREIETMGGKVRR